MTGGVATAKHDGATPARQVGTKKVTFPPDLDGSGVSAFPEDESNSNGVFAFLAEQETACRLADPRRRTIELFFPRRKTENRGYYAVSYTRQSPNGVFSNKWKHQRTPSAARDCGTTHYSVAQLARFTQRMPIWVAGKAE
jgi:hypothetical protein